MVMRLWSQQAKLRIFEVKPIEMGVVAVSFPAVGEVLGIPLGVGEVLVNLPAEAGVLVILLAAGEVVARFHTAMTVWGSFQTAWLSAAGSFLAVGEAAACEFPRYPCEAIQQG